MLLLMLCLCVDWRKGYLRSGDEQPQLVSLCDGLSGVVLALVQCHQRAVLSPHQPLIQRPAHVRVCIHLGPGSRRVSKLCSHRHE